MIHREDFSAWINEPITKALFRMLRDKRDSALEELITAPLDNLGRISSLQGLIKTVRDIEGVDRDSLKDFVDPADLG